MSAAVAARADIKRIISQNINYFMAENNKSRKDVCRALDIKYTTFCDWVNGHTSPKPEQLTRLAGYFGVDTGSFYIDNGNEADAPLRLSAYSTKLKALSSATLDTLSDDEIRELLAAGFSFRHKSLCEYMAESEFSLIASPEIDWGTPVGDELW